MDCQRSLPGVATRTDDHHAQPVEVEVLDEDLRATGPALSPHRVRLGWTAVSSRAEDATPVRRPSNASFVTTCSSSPSPDELRDIDATLERNSRAAQAQPLLATDRGSAVYGFDEAFAPRSSGGARRPRGEERALTEMPSGARRHRLAHRARVRVVYDRLNRREVDLIRSRSGRIRRSRRWAICSSPSRRDSRRPGSWGASGKSWTSRREVARAKGLPTRGSRAM